MILEADVPGLRVRALTVLVALSLVGSGCALDSPSAALDTAPAPAPAGASATASAPTSTPTPQPSVGDQVRWERIATVANAPDQRGDWRVLGGFLGGYIAIQSVPPAAWSSADGMNWTETRLRVPRGTALRVEAVAGGGEEILIGGSYTPCSRRAYERNPFSECRPRPVSWVSSDGRSWRASPHWKGPVGETGRSGSLFRQLWSVPGRGWDAVQAFDLSDESNDFELAGSTIWHSSDGLAWNLLTPDSADSVECTESLSGDVRAGADGSGRRVASIGIEQESSACVPPVWTSADGRVYAPVAEFPGTNQSVRVVLPPDDGWPWRLLGWVNRADGQPIEAIAWASHDLDTWTTTPLPGRGSIIQSATHEPGRDIAVGPPNHASMTWTSEDGTHWQIGDETSPPIETIATGPVGVLGLIGIWDDAGRTVTGFEVWKLLEER